MLIIYREQKLLEHSKKFRDVLKKKGITFEQFFRKAERLREEIADELFQNK